MKYQAVGFDMDHTLIRYRMRSFTQHVCEATAIYLANHRDYPEEIFPADAEDAARTYQFFFRAVYDHKRGNLLKIAANGLIMRAYHGFRRLDRQEILREYGKNPELPGYHILSHRQPTFTNLHEFYGASIVPMLARLVHLKSEARLPFFAQKSFYDILDDVWEAQTFNFGITDMERFRAHEYSGYFFPKFLSRLRQFVHPVCPELLQRLRRLRKRGIVTFIASNSHYEVAEVLLRETIGPDWHEYFDFVLFECQKPRFFKESDAPPPYAHLDGLGVDDLDAWLWGDKPTVESKVLLRGHADALSAAFVKRWGADYKVLFFGDTIVSDCVYCFDKSKEHNWDCVLIFEELAEVENGLGAGDYFEYWKPWGSALHDKSFFSGVSSTVVFDFADNVAHRAFSLLSSPECLCLLSVEESAAAEERQMALPATADESFFSVGLLSQSILKG